MLDGWMDGRARKEMGTQGIRKTPPGWMDTGLARLRTKRTQKRERGDKWATKRDRCWTKKKKKVTQSKRRITNTGRRKGAGKRFIFKEKAMLATAIFFTRNNIKTPFSLTLSLMR